MKTSPNNRLDLILTAAFLALGLLAFFYLAWVVSEQRGLSFDQSGILWLRQVWPDSFHLMSWLSTIGSTLFMTAFVTIAFLACFFLRHLPEGIATVASALGGLLLENLFKVLIARPRPPLMLIYSSGFSFPSGHATVAAAFFGLLALFSFRLFPSWLSWLISILSLALILGIGISRVWLGAHYPSDVLAGFALGISWALSLKLIIRKYTKS